MKIPVLLLTLWSSSFIFSQETEYHQYLNAYYEAVDESGLKKSEHSLQKLISSAKTEESKLALTASLTNLVLYRKTSPLSPAEINTVKKIYLELSNFANTKGVKNLSPFFLNSMGEFAFRAMIYYPLNQMIKISLDAKTYFETVLQKDKNNFSAYLNLGQWYYYSPTVGGGSMRKALQYYNDAEKKGTEPYQKYLTYIWRGQVYFKTKDSKRYKEDMAKAAGVFPNQGVFYDTVEARNQKGLSL